MSSSARRQFRVSTCARATGAGTACRAACEPGRPLGTLLRAALARHLATGHRNPSRWHMLTRDHKRTALACQPARLSNARPERRHPQRMFYNGRGVGAREAGRPEARTIAALLALLSNPPFPTEPLHCDSASATTATTAEMPTSAKRIGHTMPAGCLCCCSASRRAGLFCETLLGSRYVSSSRHRQGSHRPYAPRFPSTADTASISIDSESIRRTAYYRALHRIASCPSLSSRPRRSPAIQACFTGPDTECPNPA